jgi:hypothetical protein
MAHNQMPSRGHPEAMQRPFRHNQEEIRGQSETLKRPSVVLTCRAQARDDPARRSKLLECKATEELSTEHDERLQGGEC